MKITDVRTRALQWSQQPTTLVANMVSPTSIFPDHRDRRERWWGPISLVVVEVFTNEGVVGIGSAGTFTGVSKQVIDLHLKDLIIGEDPFNTEILWHKMYRSTIRFGRKGATVSAISAIDIALWDIKGKTLRQPLYNLLGGKTKERIPVYVSRLYALEDLDALQEEARHWVRLGFRAMKQRFGFGPEHGLPGMKRNIELVRRVREAVGDEIELMADAYMGWNVEYTLEMAKRLQEFNLRWIEEPLLPDELDGYSRLVRESPIPIAMGEHEYTRYGFKELIDRRCAHILQPDANRAGGITEMQRIYALAAAADIPVVPHSNEAHNLHLITANFNSPIAEYFPPVEPDTGNELFWRVFKGEPEARDGYLQPSSEPGLGVELDEDQVRELLWRER
jgi:L-rhamnonate dehydratase